MLVLNASEIRSLAPMARLIECLENEFRTGSVAPARQIARLPGGSGTRLLLSMPAFDQKGVAAVKLVTYFPDAVTVPVNPSNANMVCKLVRSLSYDAIAVP
jgi:ornithine cyclodeaminase/alanine dehydrogenase-like protein (mu-crystallin family)